MVNLDIARYGRLLALLAVLTLVVGACDDEPAGGEADLVSDATDLTDVSDQADAGADLPADTNADAADDAGADAEDAAAEEVDAAEDADVDLEVADDLDGAADGDDGGEVAVPLEGFGDISGQCGVLDDEEWSDPGSFFFSNALDFGNDYYDTTDFALLSAGGQEIISDGGFNDQSVLSEAFAYEVLYRCELAEMLKTEGEVDYTNVNGDRTDVLVRIDGRQIGVSVTRAHPMDNPFDVARAQSLLEQKLQGVLDSTANVTGADVWERQILHVIAADETRAQALEDAYPLVSEELRSNTIVIVTRTDGEDGPLY